MTKQKRKLFERVVKMTRCYQRTTYKVLGVVVRERMEYTGGKASRAVKALMSPGAGA